MLLWILNKFILPCFECKKQRVQAITAVAALTADNAAKWKKREFNQSFQPGKCFHQLCFAPSSFLSLLLPCQVQDGQEKTKNKVLPKLYASLTVIASYHSMLYHSLGGSFDSMQVLTSAVDWHSYTKNVLYYFLCF